MSLELQNCHPKIIESVERMLIDIKYGMPFYGEFNLNINFRNATKRLPTCGVNVKSSGMYFYYNENFLNDLGTVDGEIVGKTEEERLHNMWERQKQINFIVIHEDYHLLFNHPQRTVAGRFDPYLANVVQDMIINSIIWEDIDHGFVSIPKYPDNEENRANNTAGKNMALFLPPEYIKEGGMPIFEQLYNWMREKKREHDEEKAKGEGGGQGDNDNGEGESDYGPYGMSGNQTVDTYSLESIFDNIDNTQGQYMDVHMEDEIPEELRESIVNDVVERMRARGLVKGGHEETLNKLRKKRKDYLREIKRSIANEIFGTNKTPTITRPNRRGIKGIKGNRKIKNQINVLLDTSGSMHGMIEKTLEYIFRNDIEIYICQVDTEVHSMEAISSMEELQKMDITGFGGTILQPGIDLITKSKIYNRLNTVILTDGYCDTLDMSKMNGRVLGISCGDPIPISSKPKKGYREIIIENTK